MKWSRCIKWMKVYYKTSYCCWLFGVKFVNFFSATFMYGLGALWASSDCCFNLQYWHFKVLTFKKKNQTRNTLKWSFQYSIHEVIKISTWNIYYAHIATLFCSTLWFSKLFLYDLNEENSKEKKKPHQNKYIFYRC